MRTLAILVLLALPSLARAGYEMPCHIDGCQSVDGRYTIIAEPVGRIANHGPNQWNFVWHDNRTSDTRKFPAKGVSGGQTHSQLFIAPDGETFALFNHVTLWYPGKSDMHGATKLWGDRAGTPKDIQHEAFSRRIIIYRKDGTILKELGICDLLTPAELESVTTVFTRVHWIQEYPEFKTWKKAIRPAYAFCQVSPDYTVLEVHAIVPRGVKERTGRIVRVSLTDGSVLPADARLSHEKTPVRPVVGPAEPPDAETKTREGFVPSLDPVRVPGKFGWTAPKPANDLKPVE